MHRASIIPESHMSVPGTNFMLSMHNGGVYYLHRAKHHHQETVNIEAGARSVYVTAFKRDSRFTSSSFEFY